MTWKLSKRDGKGVWGKTDTGFPPIFQKKGAPQVVFSCAPFLKGLRSGQDGGRGLGVVRRRWGWGERGGRWVTKAKPRLATQDVNGEIGVDGN